MSVPVTQTLRMVDVDPARLRDILARLKWHTPEGYVRNRQALEMFVDPNGETAVPVMDGLTQGLARQMVTREVAAPAMIPQLLAGYLFWETGEDVTVRQCLVAFYELDFDTQLSIAVETHNQPRGTADVHDLKQLNYETHEAKAVAEAKDDPDFELDLRIGFDRTRLTLRADGLRCVSNQVLAETAPKPGGAEDPDYSGWFKMRLAGRTPLMWVFDPQEEGGVLDGRVDADLVGRVETAQGAGVVAEITARREALKVRIVDADGGRKASKSLADAHRDKMCAAVVRKSIAGAAEEYLLHREVLVTPNEGEGD